MSGVTLHYSGNVVDMIGEVKGPTTLSPEDYVTAVSASYAQYDRDPARSDVTTVTFRHGIRCKGCLELVDVTEARSGFVAFAVKHCLPFWHESCVSDE
jgi:hypothetical protein